MKFLRYIGWISFAASLVVFVGPNPVSAYEPQLDELIERALPTQSLVDRLIFEVTTTVFDPNAIPEKKGGIPVANEQGATSPDAISGVVVQPERSYFQKIYWVREKITAVETFSSSGEPLHFYFSEQFKPVSVNLGQERIFGDWDIVPAFLPFLSAKRAVWQEGLVNWGVNPEKVELLRSPKGQIFYIMQGKPRQYAKIQRDGFRVVRIASEIQGGDTRRQLHIEFSEFMMHGRWNSEVEGVFFPRTTSYLLDGKLFRQSVVTKFEANPSWRVFPLSRLREMASKHVPTQAISLTGQNMQEGN